MAAVAPMLRIADAVLMEIFSEKNTQFPIITNRFIVKTNGYHNPMHPWKKGDSVLIPIEHEADLVELDEKRKRQLSILLYLSIAYSSTIGGVATLTGNGPNLVMKSVLNE